MSVARFMQLCLSHPEHGYYLTRDPLGAAGDFITAPEISQMFGEMIGIWVAEVAARIGPFALVELGPGRGTLMADVLRVTKRLGHSPEVWFVETSPTLRAAQAVNVPQATWANNLAEVPDGPMILLANEFFDALPVRQFLRAGDGWRERVVGVDNNGLSWGLSAALPGRDAAIEGAWREQSPAAETVLDEIARRLATTASATLVIDYGYTRLDRPSGPTVQAMRAHAPADPLSGPGHCDLTWLLDFDAMAQALPGAAVTNQGAFLARMGIGTRAAQLAEARPKEVDALADALERLTAPDQMGHLFKVLGAASPGLGPLPGIGD